MLKNLRRVRPMWADDPVQMGREILAVLRDAEQARGIREAAYETAIANSCGSVEFTIMSPCSRTK